jgi:hypothetical protein
MVLTTVIRQMDPWITKRSSSACQCAFVCGSSARMTLRGGTSTKYPLLAASSC